MDSASIAAAMNSGDMVTLINALELTNAEIIPLPGDETMLLGTVGATSIVVTSDGALRLHGHSGGPIQAQACQARMSRELWEEVTGFMYAVAGGAVGPDNYEGKHVLPE